MPFLGNAGNAGEVIIGLVGTTRNQGFPLLANSATAITRPLNITSMGRVSLIVIQTAGVPGTFQLLIRTQGNAPNIPLPILAIAALNVPVHVSFTLFARSCVTRVFAPAAGGPHSFQVIMMAAAAGV